MRRFDDILTAVARAAKRSKRELIDGKRDRSCDKWKFFLCWKVRQETLLSYRQIAERCSLVSYTSVMGRVAKFEKALADGEEWARRMRAAVGVVPVCQTPRTAPHTVAEAVERSCVKYDVSEDDFYSTKVSPAIVEARHNAICLLRMNGMGTTAIARAIGRNRSTVLKVLQQKIWCGETRNLL